MFDYEVYVADTPMRTYRCVGGLMDGELVSIPAEAMWYVAGIGDSDAQCLYVLDWQEVGSEHGSTRREAVLVCERIWTYGDRQQLKSASITSYTNRFTS